MISRNEECFYGNPLPRGRLHSPQAQDHYAIRQRRAYTPSWPTESSSSPPPTLGRWHHSPRSLGLPPSDGSCCRHSTWTPKLPTVMLPPQHYIDIATPSSLMNRKSLINANEITPKLLVLDLNGALVYRDRSYDAHKCHPRPYLPCFLEYLFLPEPEDLQPLKKLNQRPWEVFVWSSAQPHNVRAMVEVTFGPKWITGIWEKENKKAKKRREQGEGRLHGVWARDKMGLTNYDYSRKVQTTKDLRKVIQHLSDSKRPPDLRVHFDESTTVLLDDSPLKAIYQPWSQIVIPQYDAQTNRTSRTIAGLNHDHEQSDTTEGQEMDKTLLAVIGILEELRHVVNVPLWIRAGGLTFTLDLDNLSNPTLESLPSHETYVHWWKDKTLLSKWVAKGEKALERKGIPLRHGLDIPLYTPSLKGQKPNDASTKGHKTSQQDEPKGPEDHYFKQYSPSRPC
ncbi:hypothetical protein L204_105657 [Cryptococcus depauperatus]|nr:hypothetical protein L204_02576 [Cryptococcus depauperatus CBS 7855]